MIQLGQHPAPTHVIAHISDTHLLAGGRPLYGSVATEEHLARALSKLERSRAVPQALVFTGDLADLGEPDAYERLKAIVEPAAERMGAAVIWVMGNHDEREPYSSVLLGEEPSTKPQDRVHDIAGLRVISLDTTVPGWHHGELTDGQLEWLAGVLATPAPHGTLIAVHHPPIPTPLLEAMGILELLDQQRLADVVRGTDVRGILGGHLHYSTHSLFAGIPVSVAAATCYTLDLTRGDRLLSGTDAGQAINLVHVYDDRIVHSIAPLEEAEEVTAFGAEHLATLAAMTPEARRAAFSDKRSTFNLGATAGD